VEPSLRSQLRDTLRARCEAEGWRALVAQHGTPLLVLDPYRVVEQCRLLASHLRGFRLHYAVKTSPHPAVLRGLPPAAAALTCDDG
jgi:ornithine decarboxylase